MMDKYYCVSDKEPESAGEYRVMRRAIGNRPDFEDRCFFDRSDGRPRWRNRQGKVIVSVVGWYGPEQN